MRNGMLVAGALALFALSPVSLGLVLWAPPALADSSFRAASSGHLVRPWPITITVRTVPVLRDVGFSFDGLPLTTNAQGTAAVTEQHNFDQHTLRLLRTRITRSDRRYIFARWAGQRDPNLAFRATVGGLPMRANYIVTAGFTVLCPVTPRFVTQHGNALDPLSISQVTVKSNAGQLAVIAPKGTSWLACSRPVYRDNSLFASAIRYSVQNIVISGANIVHEGAERFAPMTNATPTFVGYFHRLTITAHDALFGGKTGTMAIVRLPDGSSSRARLRSGHAVTLDLPQGSYGVTVHVGGSVVLSEKLRLSRDKTVNLTAVSHGDLLSVGGALLTAVLALPLLSKARRRRLADLLRRRQEVRLT